MTRLLGAHFRPPPAHRMAAGAAALAGHPVRQEVDYTAGLPWDGSAMLGNDYLGNCVECALLQLARIRWKLTSGDDYRPTTGMAVQMYRQYAGYDITQPGPGPGTDVQTALNLWGVNGVEIKPALLDIGPWFSADPENTESIRAAIYFGTGSLMTVRLYPGDDTATEWGDPPADAETIGSHEVVAVAYSLAGVRVVTWDVLMPVTWPGLLARLQGVSVPLSRLVTGAGGVTPAGVRWDDAVADIQAALKG